ncbi:MAG: hypothetical protein AABX52_00420 [Nanoarchaeota archaeon]
MFKDHGLLITSIVAIVSIVGLVVLFSSTILQQPTGFASHEPGGPPCKFVDICLEYIDYAIVPIQKPDFELVPTSLYPYGWEKRCIKRGFRKLCGWLLPDAPPPIKYESLVPKEVVVKTPKRW